jgi:hypothetical protein
MEATTGFLGSNVQNKPTGNTSLNLGNN